MKSSGCVGVVLAWIVATVTFPFLALLDGLVFAKLWGWFVVPALHLPPIGAVTGAGIGIAVGLLVRRVGAYEPEKQTEAERRAGLFRFLAYLVCPLVVLGTGWVIHAVAGSQ